MERESRRRQAIDEARKDKFDMEQDGDIASKKHREDIDNVAYAEALNEAVCGYTGIKTDGTPYNFIACLGQFYRQIAGRMATRYDLSEAGISDAGISDKNLSRVVRLVCKTKELARREGHEESPEKIMEMILEVLPRDYTEKERKFIKNFVFDAGYPLSFDASAGEEDEAGAAPEPEDKKNAVKDAEDMKLAQDILRTFCEDIEKKWAFIESGKELRKKKTIQLFCTADMMKELKLDGKGTGEPYSEEPAGDEEFYLVLEPQGDFLYRKLLYQKYLQRAFAEYPGDFYEVYAKLLRKDFEFTDKMIAEVEGKDASTISRERQNYLKWMKALRDFSISRG